MPQIKNNDTDNGAKGLFSTIGDAIGVAFQELGETISSAFNEQKFYNSRLKCIEYITNRGNVKTAVVTMHLKKTRSRLMYVSIFYLPRQMAKSSRTNRSMMWI